MVERLLGWWEKQPQAFKFSLCVFCFVVFTFSSVMLYMGSIDRLNIDPNKVYDYPVALVDSQIYAEYGQRFAELGIYSDSTEPPYIKATSWPIGYPALLALSWKIFGSFIPLVILQILLAGLSAVLIYRMARHFVPNSIALIPAIILGLDPSIAYYTGVVFTDGLFMSLMTILVYGLFFYKNRDWTIFVLLGFLLGFSALVRTIAQYLIVVLPLMYLVYAYTQDWKLRRATINMTIFTVVAIMVVYPAMQRNYEVIGRHKLGTIGDKMLMQYYVADWLTLEAGTDYNGDFTNSETADTVRTKLLLEAEQLALENNSKPEAYNDVVAISHILADPISYARYHVIGSLSYFVSGSYRHYLVSILGLYQRNAGLPYIQHENLAHRVTRALHSGEPTEIITAIKSLSFVLIEVTWRLLIIALALIAIIFTPKPGRWLMVTFWLLIGYFWFLTGPSAMTRYRIVSEPLLLTLATIGGWQLYLWLATLYQKHRRAIEARINPLQFIKYFVVVFIGLCIDYALLFLLTSAGLWYLYAAAISFTVALTSNYLLASAFVFKQETQHRTAKKFFLFVTVGFGTLLLNQVLMFGFVEVGGLGLFVSKTFTLPFTFVCNYFLNKLFVFKKLTLV